MIIYLVKFLPEKSDLESSSEWEDGGGGVGATAVERLSKDTVYQAYLKMRTRYHKYKGRYATWLFICWCVSVFWFVVLMHLVQLLGSSTNRAGVLYQLSTAGG